MPDPASPNRIRDGACARRLDEVGLHSRQSCRPGAFRPIFCVDADSAQAHSR